MDRDAISLDALSSFVQDLYKNIRRAIRRCKAHTEPLLLRRSKLKLPTLFLVTVVTSNHQGRPLFPVVAYDYFTRKGLVVNDRRATWPDKPDDRRHTARPEISDPGEAPFVFHLSCFESIGPRHQWPGLQQRPVSQAMWHDP